MRVSKGFTLLEILVATAIMAFALVTIMTAQGNTLLASRRAEMLTTAVLLAKQQMVEVELELEKGMRQGEFPDEKTEEGKFESPYDGFRWKAEVQRVSLPAPVVGEEGSMQNLIGKQLTEQISQSVREVKLTIFWDESGEEQSIDVVTHLVKM